MGLQTFQFDNLWVALALWVLVYCADYYLTLKGARLMAEVGKTYFDMGGSYELNPLFQKDVDSLRRISPRFVAFLVGFSLWLVLMWLVTQALHIVPAFTAGAGFLILMEIPVLSGHIRNLSLFTALKTPGAVEGRIHYSRWVSFRMTTWSFGLWGLIYALFFALTGSLFFFGGIVSIFLLFNRYSRMSAAYRRQLDTLENNVRESEV
ncbi:MAG: hypothetical protein K8I60_00890 [Anaerolineae bacterium]|nr:hypothetical protein [Anaerolineae bacterium]